MLSWINMAEPQPPPRPCSPGPAPLELKLAWSPVATDPVKRRNPQFSLPWLKWGWARVCAPPQPPASGYILHDALRSRVGRL